MAGDIGPVVSPTGQYTSCAVDAREKGYRFGTPPDNTVGANAVGGTGGPGLNNVDIIRLQCYFLYQKNKGIAGNTAVLSIPNYADCRIDVVPDVSAVLERASQLYGGGRDKNFMGKLAADLEDANVSGEGADGLKSILAAMANMPRQGTDGRAMLETARKIAVEGVYLIANTLKNSVGAAYGDTIDAVIKFLLSTIDMAFQMGDYITEFMAARNEAAARYYSVERINAITTSFERAYGVKPSMATIGAWCRHGNLEAFETDDNQGYLAAPDDPSGKMTARAMELKAIRRIADENLGAIEKRFGGDWKRFFGLSSLLGVWQAMYEPDEFDESRTFIGELVDPTGKSDNNAGGTSIYEVVRDAAKDGSSGNFKKSMWEESGNVDKKFRNKPMFKGNNEARIALDSTGNNEARTIEPWWADRGETNKSSGVSIQDLQLISNSSTVWALASYPPDILWKVKDGQRQYMYMKKSNRIGDRFGSDMWAVWGFWTAYINRQFPYNGKIKRRQEFQKFLVSNANRFMSVAQGRDPSVDAKLDKASWGARLMWATLGEIINIQQGAPKPTGDARPCPPNTQGGDTGTSCLPCAVTRTRLPIGAKSFPIPMLIEFTGKNSRGSPEFKKWAESLRTNGYPDFYIDCIARDATWVSKTAGWVQKKEFLKESAPMTATGTAYSSAAASYAKKGGTGAAKKTALYGLGDVVGLTAPTIAVVGALPPPVMPQLTGITRPLIIEVLPSQRRKG